MKFLLTGIDWLSRLMFVLAALLVAAIVVVVAYDVITRNLGLPIWAVNSVEYAMLHVTFLALPELVRTRGHVCVELLLTTLRGSLRRRLETALHIAAAAICLYLAWRSGVAFETALVDGSYEVRSFDTPMWVLYLTMPIGFLLGALEFIAFPLRGDSYFADAGASQGGL